MNVCLNFSTFIFSTSMETLSINQFIQQVRSL
jgi:hypothetical protein